MVTYAYAQENGFLTRCVKRLNALTFPLFMRLSTTVGRFGGEEEIEIEFDFDTEERTLLEMGESAMEWGRDNQGGFLKCSVK